MAKLDPISGKILSIEGLRGLLAWWVVLGHVANTFGWKVNLINKNGLAVDLFIILSGFVIARLLVQKGENYGTFITRRAFRLFPAYILALTVSALLLEVQFSAWINVPFETPGNKIRIVLAQEALTNLPKHLIAHIPLVQSFVPQWALPHSPYTVIGQAWSVSLEWFFYICAPIVVACFKGRWFCTLGIVFITTSVVSVGGMPIGLSGAKVILFAVGIFSYFWGELPELRGVYLPLGLGSAAISIALNGPIMIVPLLIWVVVLRSIYSTPIKGTGPIIRLLQTRAALLHGKISYSIYLFHMIPLYCAVYMLNSTDTSLVIYQFLCFFFVILATYLLSILTFTMVERPCMQLGNRLTCN